MKKVLLSLCLTFIANQSVAGDVQIVDVQARYSGAAWQFDVTLRHDDSGWDHYADGWGIYAADGSELGYRVLAHPHVDEQPFTRSLTGVVIPSDQTFVLIHPSVNNHATTAVLKFYLPR